jgi:hypothetical protein
MLIWYFKGNVGKFLREDILLIVGKKVIEQKEEYL